jgi:glycosyltransferase involved in cell wall biosynthesis
MISRLILHAPLNSLSLGNVSFNILRELYARKVQCVIFPKGPVDLSAYKVEPQFGAWIERAVNSRYQKFDRKVPTLAVWHIQGSELKPSDKQVLLSFHETDSPTEHEVNIVNQQDHTFFSSTWSVENFRSFGAQNVSFVPLGFDPDLAVPAKRLTSPDVTHWICVGKFEELRKLTGYKIRQWIAKFGGDPKHFLTLCVENPFYDRQRNGFNTEDLLNQVFQGQKPFNVNVLGRLKTNAEMAQLYQSADVELGLSRSEGWNLPSFNATALGKWSIVSDCTAHKDWATADNAILVEPTGMVKAVDNFFFVENAPFSSGNMFTFADDAFPAALEEAAKRAKTPNPAGEKLRETFTWKRTVDGILEKIGD